MLDYIFFLQNPSPNGTKTLIYADRLALLVMIELSRNAA